MRVYGQSMTPLLQSGDLVFVCERSYSSRLPKRNEVVAAQPRALQGKSLIKRLVGIPHDQVQIGAQSWQLDADQYFLLGDKRSESTDSRVFGPVSLRELIGPIRPVWPRRTKSKLTHPAPSS